MNIALVPARAGSKRLPGKNTRELGGMPLIMWTLEAASRSDCYDKIAVCTDDEAVREVCRSRPHIWDYIIDREPVSDTQADIEWVVPAIEKLGGCAAFSILRPTSPFRSAETIQRAWALWHPIADRVDSMRSMRRAREHPGKMWRAGGKAQWKSQPYTSHITMFWNQPTQALEPLYVQTAGLEIAHSRVLPRSISGHAVAPFILDGPEALDINTLADWWVAERFIAEGLV